MVKSVTMSDVAKDMGVSTVTVSKAITGKDGVSSEMREQIIARAAEMGYEYTKGKETVKSVKTQNIGIIIMERFISDDAFYSKICQGIVRQLMTVNAVGLLEMVPRNDEKKGVIPQLIQNERVDGLILLGQMDKNYTDIVTKQGIPYIYLDTYREGEKTDSVVSDSVQGAYMLTKMLLDKGHTDIGFVGSYNATSSIMDRYLGFTKALLEKGLTVRPKCVIEDRDENGKFVPVDYPKDMPTAFVCNCDSLAFNMINDLKKMGFSIPEDIEIVGFDDSIHAVLSDPNLTTYRVDIDGMVKNAVNIILNKIEDRNYAIGKVVVEGDIIIRESTK